MPRNKEGSTRIKDGKLYARVTYQDDNGKTKEIWRKAENRTHAKELIKQILRTLDDHGSKPLQAEQMTFQELANFYIENYLQKAEYINGRKVFGLRSYDTARYNFKPVVHDFES
ncbi:MAG: hypothetical protein JNM06_15015 [Blastocatellia bacterium]|nr:hypothetical protein [Blastocatellia bacterium]